MGISGHKQVVGMQDLQVLTTFYLFHPFLLGGGGARDPGSGYPGCGIKCQTSKKDKHQPFTLQ